MRGRLNLIVLMRALAGDCGWHDTNDLTERRGPGQSPTPIDSRVLAPYVFRGDSTLGIPEHPHTCAHSCSF